MREKKRKPSPEVLLLNERNRLRNEKSSESSKLFMAGEITAEEFLSREIDLYRPEEPA